MPIPKHGSKERMVVDNWDFPLVPATIVNKVITDEIPVIIEYPLVTPIIGYP